MWQALAVSGESALFGDAVKGGGDVNGDGYADIAVGTPHYYDYVWGYAEKILVYHGGPNGPSATPSFTYDTERYGYYGSALAFADVNGDGYDDLIAGSRSHSTYWWNWEQGLFFLFPGSAQGLSEEPTWVGTEDDDLSIFGSSVANAGDVNRDGYDDLIIGAPRWSDSEQETGAAFLLLGNAEGLLEIPDQVLSGAAPLSQFGGSVAGAGDVNGDGYDDVIVGALDETSGDDPAVEMQGAAYVYLGTPDGLATEPAWRVAGTGHRALLGVAVAGAGDVNHDGYDDVLVGATGAAEGPGSEGVVYLYLGGSQGLSQSAAWTGKGSGLDTRYGVALDGLGDVNGDGFDDVAVAAPDKVNAQGGGGEVYVYLGSSAGLLQEPEWTASTGENASGFGGSLSRAGDVNGDGFGDLLVGASGYPNPDGSLGRALVYLGQGHAPVIDPLENLSVKVGKELSFSVTAADADGTTPQLSAQPPLPAGSSFTGGVFRWTPVPSQAGTHVISFLASDGKLTDTASVQITVVAASTPTGGNNGGNANSGDGDEEDGGNSGGIETFVYLVSGGTCYLETLREEW